MSNERADESRDSRIGGADFRPNPDDPHYEYWGDWPTVSFGRAIYYLERFRKDYYDAELEPLGISAADMPVLALMWEGHSGDTQVEIAQLLGLDPATITRTMQRLEDAGLISRVRSEEDNRALLVSLTEEGWELARPVRDIAVRFNEMLTEGWSERKIQEVRSSLQKMVVRVQSQLQPEVDEAASPAAPYVSD